MDTYRLRSFTELAVSPAEWNRLSAGVPFRSYDWLSNWWQHYQPAMSAAGRQVELYLLQVVDGNELIAIAPWYIDRSRTSGSVVRLLGSGEVCSDYLSVLCLPERAKQVAEEIADWLTQTSDVVSKTDNRWDTIELANVIPGDGMHELLVDQLRVRGAEVHVSPAINTWRLELPASMEEYLDLLSKSHRKQLRQFQRRLFDSGRAVLRTVEQADQIETGWNILKHLHQRRMESLGKPGCFTSPSFAQFHRAATEALFHSSHLRLHWLELDGQPVAAEYHLAGDDVMFAYQGGIEPNALEHEPGRLITLATLDRAIRDGYRAFDFCRGDEPYKPHWRAQPCENVSLRIVCNRTSARLRHSMWIAGQSARKWMKGSLQLAMRKSK